MENKKVSEINVTIKGYKKFMKRIRKMRREIEKLNKTMERTVELKKNYSDSITIPIPQ